MNQPKRGRGRPRADKTALQAKNSRVELEADRVEEAHSANRPPRESMGATLKLSLPPGLVDEEKWHPRWMSDRDGRIEQAKRCWYELVKDTDGHNITRTNGPYKQFLMKIEKKYWLEEQKIETR